MKKLLALGAALVLAVPGMAAAQSSAGATASVTIADQTSIQIDETDIEFGSVSSVGYQAPTAGSPVNVEHTSNQVHNVFIRADAANFTGGGGSKPAADLEWSLDSGDNWTPISTSDQQLVGLAPAGTDDFDVDFQLNVTLSDVPDTYTLGITFSIAPN